MIDEDLDKFIFAVNSLERLKADKRKLLRLPSSLSIDAQINDAERTVSEWRRHFSDWISQLRRERQDYPDIIDYIVSHSFSNCALLESNELKIGQRVLYCGKGIEGHLKQGDIVYYYGRDPEINFLHLIGKELEQITSLYSVQRFYHLTHTSTYRESITKIDLKNPTGWG